MKKRTGLLLSLRSGLILLDELLESQSLSFDAPEAGLDE